MALLSMRVSGTNLDAFRHALERQAPLEYLASATTAAGSKRPRTC